MQAGLKSDRNIRHFTVRRKCF